MTHKERLIELLDDMGVGYELNQPVFCDLPNVVIESRKGDKNRGYVGFYCSFKFDDEGNLDFVGCWE